MAARIHTASLMRRRLSRWLGAVAALVALQGPALVLAQPAAPAASAAGNVAPLPAAEAQANAVVVNHRPIVSLHATVMGRSPNERALAGNTAVGLVLERQGPGKVDLWQGSDGTAGLKLDGVMVVYLVAEDFDAGTTLSTAVEAARARLQHAIDEVREARDPRRIAWGVAYSAVATLVAYVLLRAAFALRRRIVTRVAMLVDRWRPEHAAKTLIATYAPHARSAALSLAVVVTWCFVLLVIDLWATFVMQQFAFTRAWGERSSEWLLGELGRIATDVLTAVPGLLTAVLIFFIARLVTRANTALLQRVERGDLVTAWFDRDTAGPTRRISNFVIWLFALALAYPFFPGANSDAFKGVSVLAGLMLSLGASSVVGQVMAGLSLMYSRSLRVGEYVKVADIEGTVILVGMFSTKLHTGMGEEVSVPNSVVVGHAVHNFSRLTQGDFVVHTAVTIGYSTPWRHVHAMLLEAARRTPSLVEQPAPHVFQTALSDFYVEYRLCAQSRELSPSRRVEVQSQLLAHVQDVFNENGVQIMSPHYVRDPAHPQVVAPGDWSPGLAPAAQPPNKGPA